MLNNGQIKELKEICEKHVEDPNVYLIHNLLKDREELVFLLKEIDSDIKRYTPSVDLFGVYTNLLIKLNNIMEQLK